MVCGKCGKDLPEGAIFCSYCGERCVRKVCTACGAEIKEGQLFCKVCGLRCDEGGFKGAEPSPAAKMPQGAVMPGVGPVSVKNSGPSVGDRMAWLGRTVADKVFNGIRIILYVVLLAIGIFFVIDDGFSFWWAESLFRWFAYPTLAGIAHVSYVCFKSAHDGKGMTKIDWIISISLIVLISLVFILADM